MIDELKKFWLKLCVLNFKYKQKSGLALYKLKNIPYSILVGIILLISCNPNKDKWLNRKYHTLTGHFNVYFNGEQKLIEAVKQIEATQTDNFETVLDVFPLGTAESAKSAGNVLDEALKKFSKSIQMHTIGAYTDDSYYSIGVSRFYKQEYFASIETFQYMISKYKNGPFTDLSTCWIARNYVGLKKLGEAEAIMGLLLQKKQFPKKDMALIYATAADINIKQEKYSTAIDNLKLALKGKLTKDQKVRYHYILGQLCMLANKKPEATYYFNRVIKFLPNYDFAFNATISLTRIYDLNNPKSIDKVKRSLKKMAGDEKNIDYLDQIYYELGKLEVIQKNHTAAANQFKKSIGFSTKNKNQKGLSYYELAKLYFDKKEFKLSQAYYDSTVQQLDPNHKNYAQIKETKIVLSELISNLKVFEAEDSLQKLALLSKDELERKVNGWIAEEKRLADIAAKEAKKKSKQAASMANNQNLNPSAPLTLPGSGDNSWYFYNSALINAGAAEFFSNKKWGQRLNEDYWRIAAKEKEKSEPDGALNKNDTTINASKNNGTDSKEIAAEPKENNLTGDDKKDAWIKNVPLTQAQKSRSNGRMLESLHNLGILYYDRLKNPLESKKYFEILQQRFAKSEYEPEAFYYLYKSNTDLKNGKRGEENKTLLIETYPTHPYSLLVQNKTIASAENSNNKLLMEAYQKMYDLYKNEKYIEAMAMKTEIDKQFPGNPLRPKIDLIYAFCVGKTKDRQAFKLALTDVSTTHKGLDVAAKADEFLAVLNRAEKVDAFNSGVDKKSEPLEFDLETETPFYYVLAVKNPKADLNDILSKYNAFNEAYAAENNLRVNPIMSNEGYQLITIREFPNFTAANEYLKTLKATDFLSKKLNLGEGNFEYAISTKNFKIILKEKKVEKFAEFYKKQLESLNQIK